MGKLVNIKDIKHIEDEREQYVIYIAFNNSILPFVYVTKCNKIKILCDGLYVEPKNIKEYIGSIPITALQLPPTVEDNEIYIILGEETIDDELVTNVRKYLTYDIGMVMKIVWKNFYELYRNAPINLKREELIKGYEKIKRKIQTTFKNDER